MEKTANTTDIEKGLQSRTGESGSHPHALMRNLMETKEDGRHRHIFMVRTIRGELISLPTELDGPHKHSLEEPKSIKTGDEESAHQHVIRIHYKIELEDGTVLTPGIVRITKLDGKHSHGADMLETTNYDGAHKHELVINDEMTLESLDVAQYWDTFGPFDMSDISPIYSTDQIEDRFNCQPYFPVQKSYSGYLDESDNAPWKKILKASFGEAEGSGTEVIFKAKEVQEVIFSKKRFKDKETVEERLSDLQYKDADIEDQEKEYRAEVKRPSKFKKDSLKELRLESGIKVVVGVLREDHIAKEQEQFERVAKACPNQVEIYKQDDEKRIVTGIVLEPDVFDDQGDTITEDEIEKSAAFFLQKSRTIGFRHRGKAKAVLVGSMVMPAGFTIKGSNGKQKVKKGTWLISVHVPDDKLWSQIKKKSINAFSVGGFGSREPIGKSAEDWGELNWVASNQET